MGERVDLTGKKFGLLTVIGFAGIGKSNKKMWLCRCECGVERAMMQDNLVRAKSCGCLRPVNNKGNLIHGDSRTRLYGVWKDMRRRCNPKFAKKYPYHAGKGISVCEEWNDWLNFKAWAVGHGYEDGLTIDRIDGDMGYFPNNCRWATRAEQCNNLKSNVHVEYRGKDYTLGELAKSEGIAYQRLRDRVRDLHWSIDRAVNAGKQDRIRAERK